MSSALINIQFPYGFPLYMYDNNKNRRGAHALL